MLYPSIGLFVPYLPELDAGRVGRTRAGRYNDWIADVLRGATRRRLAGVGIVPLADVGLRRGGDAERGRRSASSA